MCVYVLLQEGFAHAADPCLQILFFTLKMADGLKNVLRLRRAVKGGLILRSPFFGGVEMMGRSNPVYDPIELIGISTETVQKQY